MSLKNCFCKILFCNSKNYYRQAQKYFPNFITMKLKRKFIGLVLLIIVACLVYFCLPQYPGLIPGYDRHIFYPFQSFRGFVLGRLPFSLGDLLYIAGGIWLLVTVIKWIRYLFRFRLYKELLALSFIRTMKTILYVYLFFIIGWGANYYKESLRESWGLISQTPAPQSDAEQAERKKKALGNLIAFDKFLVDKLNDYAPHYHALSLGKINELANEYYGTYTDSKVKRYGLEIKPTLFGYFMERLGVEGYYNPFTGEGQVNSALPAFTMPFLICHEMAHQAGIASEEDANLMAYALGTTTSDSTFRYSSYLNIWLYTNSRLYRRDSATALKFEAMLNKLTTAQLDTLDQISKKYQNEYARYSTQLFDNYLKMQDQKEGIRSYSNVAASAWLLEQKRARSETGIISIP